MTEATGSSLLTENLPPPSPAGGNPPPAPGTAAEAIRTVQDGPPEYIPPKFWDPDKKSPKIEDLGKSYMNLEKLLGREKIPVPMSETDEEGWTRWYAAAGRPETPDKYEFKRPELPSDLPYDDETEKSFRTWAHANGLNKKQANSLYDAYVKTQVERHGAYHTSVKQAKSKVEQDLRREHGQQYEGKLALAKTALREFYDPDYIEYLNETGQGNDPRVIRAWIRVGEKMSGETKLKGATPDAPNSQDLDKAITEFRTKHSDALFKKEHPEHDLRVAEYNKLFQMRYPEMAAR
jgi:hypothetical protein